MLNNTLKYTAIMLGILGMALVAKARIKPAVKKLWCIVPKAVQRVLTQRSTQRVLLLMRLRIQSLTC